MSEPVLACQALGRTFREGSLNVEVLSAVDLQVNPGERVAIVGSSGSGKSTLLHLLGGLDRPSSGEVQLAGHALTRMSDADRGRLRNELAAVSVVEMT